MTVTDDTPKDTFEAVRAFFEKYLKILPVFAGSFYIIGYIVTAIRLSQYNLPTIELLDAQYFFAGVLVGGVMWLTFFVVVSAHSYKNEEEDENTRSFRKKITAVIALFVIVLLIIDFLPIFPNNIDLILSALIFLGLEFGLFAAIIEYRDNTGKTERRSYWSNAWNLIFLLLLIVIGIDIAQSLYRNVPQVYGGGKPLSVRLYVDAKKVPGELIASNQTTESETPALTIPLHLVFRTSDEYIVDPIEDNQERAWIITASAVYASVELPHEPIPTP
jgi:hypothetical protein